MNTVQDHSATRSGDIGASDRLLLELAAKAAGITINGWSFGDDQQWWASHEPRSTDSWGWNPLVDDGDAFRLMHACGLTLWEGMVVVDRDKCYVKVHYDPEPTLEELRRAIVTAAAKLAETTTAGTPR